MSGVACLNGGRCVDAVNNYTCDCTNTGKKIELIISNKQLDMKYTVLIQKFFF